MRTSPLLTTEQTNKINRRTCCAPRPSQWRRCAGRLLTQKQDVQAKAAGAPGCWRSYPFAARSRSTPAALLAPANGAGVRVERRDVRQVHASARVTRVQQAVQDAAVGDRPHERRVELVVHDLARALKVAGADGLVVAVGFIAGVVTLLRAVACTLGVL